VAATIDGLAATDAGPEVERSNLRRTNGHSSRRPGETIFGSDILPAVMSVAAPPGSAANTVTPEPSSRAARSSV
jgi:hypothetical protein